MLPEYFPNLLLSRRLVSHNNSPWLLHTVHITGIDISETAIQWAKSKTDIPNFIRDDLLNRDALPRSSFEVAVDACLMHCIIGEDRSKVLNNLHYWLKPNGHFILYTMCGDPTELLEEGYCKKTKCIMRGELAIRYLGDPDDIIHEIESSNFKTIHCELIGNMLVS